jgi:hypothetical protein
MNETSLIKKLFKHFANHEYKLQNTFIFNWESDFFCVSNSGYTVEVEVKISKSDFKADFKKSEKHFILQNADKETLTITHSVYADRTIKPFAPNKFYYCCPEGIIDVKDLPDYAGLLVLSEKDGCKELVKVRSAKFLHKRTPDISKILLNKYYYLYLNARSEYSALLWRLNEIEKDFTYKTAPNMKFVDEPMYFEQKLFEDDPPRS